MLWGIVMLQLGLAGEEDFAEMATVESGSAVPMRGVGTDAF